ncbi:MAG TPA: FG-GAP-like repeat-containing protein [Acidobacteriaceae bacterium]
MMLTLRPLVLYSLLFAAPFYSCELFGQQTSTTTLSASPTTISVGQGVTISATVSGPNNTIPIPSGGVSFLDGSTGLGSSNLSSVAVTAPKSIIYAQYFGSSNLGLINTGNMWADLNGDGKPDLLSYTPFGGAEAFLNNGDGTFLAKSSPTCSTGASVALIDFNGDGKIDILTLNFNSNNVGTVKVCYGNGDGTFQASVAAPGIQAPTSTTGITIEPFTVAVADLRGTGTPDIILGDQTQDTLGNSAPNASITIFQNGGHGNFTSLGSFPVSTASLSEQSIEQILPVDLNGDGVLDVAVTVENIIRNGNSISFSEAVVVLLNQGNGAFTLPSATLSATCPDYGCTMPWVTTADFANRGKTDIAFLNDGGIDVYPGNGDGTFAAPAHTQDKGAAQILTEDIDGNGKMDIIEAGGYAYLGGGDFTFTPTTNLLSLGDPGNSHGRPVSELIADFNGDGIPDLLFTYSGEGNSTFGVIQLGSRNAIAALSPVTTLASGIHVITAQYAGNSYFASNTSAAVNITVNKFATTISNAAAAPNPALSTQSVKLSAQVHSPGPIPTGTLTFAEGGTVLGTATLDASGMVAINKTFGTVGSQNITLTYSGDAANLPSSASVTAITAANFPSNIAFTASPNPVVAGQPITLSAVVSATNTAPTPTGNVVFVSGSTQLGTTALDSTGKALLSTSFPTVGNQTITANYVGDAYNQPTTGSVVEAVLSAFDFQPSGGSTTTVTVSSGSSTTLPLTVNALNGFNGKVSFTCTELPVGATCSFSPPSVSVTAAAPGTITLTLSTASSLVSTSVAPFDTHPTVFIAATLFGCFIFLLPRNRRYRIRGVPFLCLILAFAGFGIAGCGGGSTSPVTPTTYSFNVVANSGSVQQKTSYTLIVQ